MLFTLDGARKLIAQNRKLIAQNRKLGVAMEGVCPWMSSFTHSIGRLHALENEEAGDALDQLDDTRK